MNRVWTRATASSRRTARALACGVGAVLLVGTTFPARNDGAVTSLSIVPTSSQAQITIGIEGAVQVRDFVLRNPDRIVVDISGAKLGFRKRGYDRVERGGVVDVRYAQNQPDVVRIVLTLTGPREYAVRHDAIGVVVSVNGGGDFLPWRAGNTGMSSPSIARSRTSDDGVTRVAPTRASNRGMIQASASVARVTTVAQTAAFDAPGLYPQQSQQPRITITWENANIRDVIAAFAAFSGRTIIASRGVNANVSAEIINQPWDVAMRAILRANGFDAVEDENGIIIVNTIQALAERPRYEPLVTQTVRFNYTSARAVAEALRQRLSRDCGEMFGNQDPLPAPQTSQIPGAAGAEPEQQVAAQQASIQQSRMQAATLSALSGGSVDLRCPQRGAVTADTLTNSVSITDAPSNMAQMIAYAQSLDVRQPQVNIKAKIILVDRTQIEGLGLKYDIGSPQQHFNDLVARVDSVGNVEQGNVIALGGNAISAIANAAQNVPGATLSLVYSAALGAFSFTTFVDALQSRSLLDVQAEPSVTTLNYRPAILSAGTQVPVRTIEPGTGGNVGGAFPQVTVQMRQTGIVLSVTPSITNNRQVMMRVHAENSDVLFQGGDVGAVFPTQSLDAEVLVADGETAVMGGLTQTSVTMTKTGIPILVDLPLIGRLFGVTTRNETKRDLLILITPHIVDEGDMAMEPRRTP